jgi:hypothetical protein
VGEKTTPKSKPEDPKAAAIHPEPDPLPSLKMRCGRSEGERGGAAGQPAGLDRERGRRRQTGRGGSIVRKMSVGEWIRWTGGGDDEWIPRVSDCEEMI